MISPLGIVEIMMVLEEGTEDHVRVESLGLRGHKIAVVNLGEAVLL